MHTKPMPKQPTKLPQKNKNNIQKYLKTKRNRLKEQNPI
jgi:hypothetical protein